MRKRGRLIKQQDFKYRTNMKHKKIIIILSVALVVIVTSVLLLRLSNNKSKVDVAEEIRTLPTGIIVPTDTVKMNELDIVSVVPIDGTEGVNVNTPIRITFSRKPQENEIDFSMGPDAIFTQEIQDNDLIITPLKPFTEGTLYTYSINFPDDNQKVRLYRFITEGVPAEVLPDTRSEDYIAEIEEQERINHPDIYITNRAPYENEDFAIESAFEPQTPAHYYFIVTPKISDTNTVEQSVNAWLQLQGLTAEQITQLDIRYQ